MCGRISQYREAERYFDLLRADPAKLFRRDPVYNVAPGTTPLIIRAGGDGIEMTTARWGYQGHAPRMYVNAKVETAESGFWRRQWQYGRILVPADGWFEWTGPKGNRQPHFIYRIDGKPMLLAAILGSDGFALLTDATNAGMLDLHDRRPVVLDEDGARRWIDPQTTPAEALLITATDALGESAFAWHDVTRAMGNSKFQDRAAIEPIEALEASRATTAAT